MLSLERNYLEEPTLLMLVGLPGSGKSTYIKEHLKDVKVHSSDNIREELSGNINDQNINSKVFELLHKRIKNDLSNGISCVYDATNVSWKRRKAFLQSLKNIDCYKLCLVIATPYEVCLEQNRLRDRVVPEYVIKRMYMNFDIPFYNEGWDDIEIWYEKDNYKNAYGDYLSFIAETTSFDQDSKWHSKTLGTHCDKCLKYVVDNDSSLSPLIWDEIHIAAALHDCGKPFTQTYKDNKGNPSEFAHYYNHECVGSYNSLFYSNVNDEYYDKLIVAALIRWHMILHFFKHWQQKTVIKYEKEFTSHRFLQEIEFYKALKLLNDADKEAH